MRWGTSSVSRIRQYVQIRLGLFPIVHEDCDIAPSASFSCVTNLSLGHHVYIGPHSFVEAKGGITIDDGVVISARVTILSSTHNYESLESIPYGGEDILRSVRIERGAWICYGALILPGVTIGEGAIVGAGAVVTKPIAPGLIVGGNPAQVIGTRRGKAWRGLLDNGLYRLKKKGTAMPTSS
jgi:maltose O-acetyltransferase